MSEQAAKGKISLPRENNLDGLRLTLAWVVVLVHIYDLSGASQLHFFGKLLSAQAAVEGFFAISGCLIVASWDRAPTAWAYFVRRAERILPAYWFALAYSVLLGALFTTLSFTAFVASPIFWRYLICNLVFLNFLQPDLPGVFAGNPEHALNGALWTIKIEVAFYLFVPVLVFACRRWGVAKTLFVVSIASATFRVLLRHHPVAAKQLPGQLCFFMTGAAFYYFFDKVQRNRALLWCVALSSVIVAGFTDLLIARMFGTPLLVLCVGLLLHPRRGITKFGDFSYGTYVLHAPTLQAIVALGLFAMPWEGLFVSVACIVVLGYVSWKCIERPLLRRERVRRAEAPA